MNHGKEKHAARMRAEKTISFRSLAIHAHNNTTLRQRHRQQECTTAQSCMISLRARDALVGDHAVAGGRAELVDEGPRIAGEGGGGLRFGTGLGDEVEVHVLAYARRGTGGTCVKKKGRVDWDVGVVVCIPSSAFTRVYHHLQGSMNQSQHPPLQKSGWKTMPVWQMVLGQLGSDG